MSWTRTATEMKLNNRTTQLTMNTTNKQWRNIKFIRFHKNKSDNDEQISSCNKKITVKSSFNAMKKILGKSRTNMTQIGK